MLIPDLSGLSKGIENAGTSLSQILQEAAKQRVLKNLFEEDQSYTSDLGNQPPPQGYQPAQTPTGALQSIVGAPPQQTPYERMVADTNANFQRQQTAINQQKKRAQQAFILGDKLTANMLMQDAYHKEQMLQQEHLQNKKLVDKISTEADKRSFEENKPYYETMNKRRQELPTQQATILSIRDALIKSDGKIGKIRNFIATYAPQDAQDFIKTANAQQLASFVKDFFVADLKGLPGGSKLNQLIEKNLLSALQSPGKTEESNQKITEFQQYKQDVLEKELEIHDKIKNQYLKVGKEPPRDFQTRVHEQLKPYVIERQGELIKTYQDIDKGKIKSAQMLNMPFARDVIKENPPREGFTYVMSPKGKPVQIPNNEVQNALNSGGVLIK